MARFEEFAERPGVIEELVQRVVDGQTLKSIAASLELPYAKLAQWVIEDPLRAERYAAASRIWADEQARHTVAIADDLGPESTKAAVNAARLQIAARQFVAPRLDRERWGERSSLDVKVDDRRLTEMDRAQLLLEAGRRVGFLIASAGRAQRVIEDASVTVVTEAAAPSPADSEDPI